MLVAAWLLGVQSLLGTPVSVSDPASACRSAGRQGLHAGSWSQDAPRLQTQAVPTQLGREDTCTCCEGLILSISVKSDTSTGPLGF